MWARGGAGFVRMLYGSNIVVFIMYQTSPHDLEIGLAKVLYTCIYGEYTHTAI